MKKLGQVSVAVSLFLLILIWNIATAQYTVEVQVVNLQVSVSDRRGDFIRDLKAEDFLVWENDISQQVLDVELQREPFSVGVLLDTSGSMQSHFQIMERATIDFLSSLQSDDEYFLMTFDDDVVLRRNFELASNRPERAWKDLRYGTKTKLFESLLSAIDLLQKAKYPRRALFLLSDGLNTYGKGSLQDAIQKAQKYKVLIYCLMVENSDSDLMALKELSESTGGSYFVLYGDFPRLQSAYRRIAEDLANRFTLYYKSTSDYSHKRKPEIRVQTRNPEWHVRFQRTYYPSS